MTISNLMKTTERFSNEYKTLRLKGKLLVSSNFSFSHSVFKRLVLQTHKKQGLFEKGLKAFADEKINLTGRTEIHFGMNRKHCGKRRKCWLPAFSLFPTMFSKLRLLSLDRKHCGKRRKCWLLAFSPFPTMFSKLRPLFQGH